METSRQAQILRLAALACWLASLMLPAFTERLVSAKEDAWPGYLVLAYGWMSLLIACPAWLANPVLLWTLARWRRMRPRWTLGLAGTGLLLALSWFIVPLTGGVPYDDGRHAIVKYNLGMYVWLASFACAVLGAYIETRTDRHTVRGN